MASRWDNIWSWRVLQTFILIYAMELLNETFKPRVRESSHHPGTGASRRIFN
jgi:hypothetical protein